MHRGNWRRAFRLALRGRKARAAEIDDDIAFHMQERIDALVARGWSIDHATAEAGRRFGDPATERAALLAAATQRDARLEAFDWIDAVRADVRLAARQLRHAPTFAFGTITAFALGIGANATMFSVVDRLLLRPPAGVAEPGNVYTLEANPRGDVSYPAFVRLRDNLSGTASVAVQTMSWPLPIGRGERAQMARTVFVSGGYFRTLGVRAAVGRMLVDDDAALPDGQPVAVIGFDLWQRQFDGDTSVVGRELVVSSTRVRIVGVAPAGFNGVGTAPLDLWLPVTLASGLLPSLGPRWPWSTTDGHWLLAIARTAPHVEPEVIASRAAALLRSADLERAAHDTTTGVEVHSVLPSRSKALSPLAKIASLLGIVSILVLLIACSNATNLMLARAIHRRREIGLRMALGASRRRLVVGLLIDALVLSLLGGLAAVIVAAAGSALMRDVLLDGMVWNGALVDGATLAFIAVTAIFAGACTVIAPAFVLLRRFDLSRAISEGRQSGGVHRHRLVSSLVVTQTVLSTTLLIGALLFVHSLRTVHGIPLGLDTEHTVVALLDGRTVRESPARADALFDEVRTAISRVPAVTSVSIADGVPFTRFFMLTTLSIPGLPPDAPAIKRGSVLRAVTSSYFATIGTRIVEGRAFTDTDDRAAGELVAIVSTDLAKELWPQRTAVGQCVRLGADSVPCRRVVGVAEQTEISAVEPAGLESPYHATVYVPLSQGRHNVGMRALVARIGAPSAEVVAQVRRAIEQAEPDMPLADVWLVQSRHDLEMKPWRLGATMFGVFGALALALAALGVYSVIGYSVAQRTGEMGIRVALGARRRHIITMVGKQGAVLAGLGVVIATAGALMFAPFVQPLLFETSARSATVYAIVSGGMFLVAVIASLLPAMRASRVSPMSVLRSQ